jgi:hypothetical protein
VTDSGADEPTHAEVSWATAVPCCLDPVSCTSPWPCVSLKRTAWREFCANRRQLPWSSVFQNVPPLGLLDSVQKSSKHATEDWDPNVLFSITVKRQEKAALCSATAWAQEARTTSYRSAPSEKTTAAALPSSGLRRVLIHYIQHTTNALVTVQSDATRHRPILQCSHTAALPLLEQ